MTASAAADSGGGSSGSSSSGSASASASHSGSSGGHSSSSSGSGGSGGGSASSSGHASAGHSSGEHAAGTAHSSGGGSGGSGGGSHAAGSAHGSGHAAASSHGGKAAAAWKHHHYIPGTHIGYGHLAPWGIPITGKSVLSAMTVGLVAGAAVGIVLGFAATCMVKRVICGCPARMCKEGCCGGYCACDPPPGKEPSCNGRCRVERCQGHHRGGCPESDGCVRGMVVGACCGCAVAGGAGVLGSTGNIHCCDPLVHRWQCIDGAIGGGVGGLYGCCNAITTQEQKDKNNPDSAKETYWWF
eukprot:TRINITY_DN1908_c1_g1_i1.p1 TRINITY_DN1908_c1_g1~~TRINITY_DN1908_c1_g1_i1.p1  ORF type:complete len:299 (+),score=29.85 TRINITY_DN1908_c1_g1_i1:98-994(+)